MLLGIGNPKTLLLFQPYQTIVQCKPIFGEHSDVDVDTDGRAGHPDEFLSKTKWQRFQVLIMGPVMNILLAFVLTAVVLYEGVEKGIYEDQPPVVGAIADHLGRTRPSVASLLRRGLAELRELLQNERE